MQYRSEVKSIQIFATLCRLSKLDKADGSTNWGEITNCPENKRGFRNEMQPDRIGSLILRGIHPILHTSILSDGLKSPHSSACEGGRYD